MREKMKVCAVICELNPLHKRASGPVRPRKIPLWGAGVRALWEFRPAGGAGHPGQVGPGPPGFGERRGPGAGAAPALGPGRGGALRRGGRGPGPGPGLRGHPALRQRGRGHPAPVAAGARRCFPRSFPRPSSRWTPPSLLPGGGSGPRPVWWERRPPPCWKSPTASWGWSTSRPSCPRGAG